MNDESERPELTTEEIVAYHTGVIEQAHLSSQLVFSYAYMLRDILVDGFMIEFPCGGDIERYMIVKNTFIADVKERENSQWKTWLVIDTSRMGGELAYNLPLGILGVIYRRCVVKRYPHTA